MLYYPGRARVVDSNGDPVVNAKLYFYVSGTTTPAPVYSDVDLTTPHTQPVRSNAAGFYPPIYFDPSVTYKSVETNEDDVALPGGTVDPVNMDVLSGVTGDSLGQRLYPRTPSEISASVVPAHYAYPAGDVRRYGAVSGTLSTAAVQTALLCNQDVLIDGTYTVSGLTMTVAGQRIVAKSRGSGFVAANNTGTVITMSGARQAIVGIDFRTTGLSANDSQPAFAAIRVSGDRCLVDSVTTGGVFTYGVSFIASLYSRLTNSNIDGFRKRAVSVTGGGTFNRIDNCMLFDASLTSPVEAIVYIDSSPSTSITHNHITRGTGKGIYATGTSPLQQLVVIENNDIDYLENWAIDINGNWNVRIAGNWCAGGQNATGSATGQIRLTNVNRFAIINNETDGALQAGSRSIHINTSSYGEIAGNTCQYTGDGIVIEASNYILVHDNIVGQMTGLPPTGVATTNCYVGIGLAFGNHVHFHDNIGYNQTGQVYLDIPPDCIQDYQLFSVATQLDGLSPTTDNSTRLGNVNRRWASVHSNVFYSGAGASGVFWTSGSGSPEGIVTAPIGSLWTRTDGSTSTTLYVKTSGSGNTGWTAK